MVKIKQRKEIQIFEFLLTKIEFFLGVNKLKKTFDGLFVTI